MLNTERQPRLGVRIARPWQEERCALRLIKRLDEPLTLFWMRGQLDPGRPNLRMVGDLVGGHETDPEAADVLPFGQLATAAHICGAVVVAAVAVAGQKPQGRVCRSPQ